MTRKFGVINHWIVALTMLALWTNSLSAQNSQRRIYSVPWNTFFSRPLLWQQFTAIADVRSDSIVCTDVLAVLKKHVSSLAPNQSASSEPIDQRIVVVDGTEVIEVGPHIIKYNGKCCTTDIQTLALIVLLLPDEYATELKHVIEDFYCSTP